MRGWRLGMPSHQLPNELLIAFLQSTFQGSVCIPALPETSLLSPRSMLPMPLELQKRTRAGNLRGSTLGHFHRQLRGLTLKPGR